MDTDFSQVDDLRDFRSIPEGNYVVRVADIRTGTTRDGSERWAFRLEVALGDYAGRTAAWDSLVWSERGLPRAKHVLAALGFDVTGVVSVAPDDLVGRMVEAAFLPEEREDPLTGQRIARMRVPYVGYEAFDGVLPEPVSAEPF